MSHYIDLQLRPDPETAPHQLLAALYAKLHQALVQTNSSTIGVSFPGYCANPAGLGTVLRLCGPAPALQQLMDLPWLKGIQDHVAVSALKAVPEKATYQRLSRVQAKSSPERLRRRQIKRHGLTEAQARERVPDNCAETLTLPFVVMRSASTGQTFRLFLRCEPRSAPSVGAFNTYGLSATATVPLF